MMVMTELYPLYHHPQACFPPVGNIRAFTGWQPAGNAEIPLGRRREVPPKPPSGNLALPDTKPTGWQPVPLNPQSLFSGSW